MALAKVRSWPGLWITTRLEVQRHYEAMPRVALVSTLVVLHRTDCGLFPVSTSWTIVSRSGRWPTSFRLALDKSARVAGERKKRKSALKGVQMKDKGVAKTSHYTGPVKVMTVREVSSYLRDS